MGKRLRIPNLDIKLTDGEIAVTQTRQFQRLFFVRQLGLAYLVYPAATHTRGTHSIQCLHEAAKVLAALGLKEDEPDVQAVRLAALLHDIGHVPFSHTLEDEHEVLTKHDRSERLANALGLLKAEVDQEVVAQIEKAVPILNAVSSPNDNDRDWKSDIVGNTVCADLLAYISTDAAMTGIEKRPGYYRIYEYFVREHDRLCIKLTKGGLRTDIVSCVMDLLDMRYALTERVIFHHAKCIASAMLARAARLCGLSESPDLLQMGDEVFLVRLEESAQKKGLTGAERTIDCIRSRHLYKRIYKIGRISRDAWDEAREPGAFCDRWRAGKKVEEMLAEVEDAHRLPHGSLALWCPDGKAGMKLAKAQVVWDSAEKGLQGPFPLRDDKVSNQFPGVAKRVRTIEEQYQDLWTFWIAIDRKYLQHAAAVISTLEDAIGIKCDPVFTETYLRQIPGFQEASSRTIAIRKGFRELEPATDDVLSQMAALDGKPHLDPDTIRAAIRSVSEQERPTPATTEVQEGLFSEETGVNDVKEPPKK